MIMSSRVYRCTRELPYSATSLPAHYDVMQREAHFITATSEENAREQMAIKFPLDIVRTSISDAFTADCLELRMLSDFEQIEQMELEPVIIDEGDGASVDKLLASVADLLFDTEPPSDDCITLIDLSDCEVDDFVNENDGECDTLPAIVPAFSLNQFEPMFSDAAEKVDFWR